MVPEIKICHFPSHFLLLLEARFSFSGSLIRSLKRLKKSGYEKIFLYVVAYLSFYYEKAIKTL